MPTIVKQQPPSTVQTFPELSQQILAGPYKVSLQDTTLYQQM